MVSATLRESIRALYDFRCGYCGVTETETGSALEIDHFQPRSHGGLDVLENLVYACPTCNRFKGDYWPAPELQPDALLLHPLHDAIAEHITLLSDGRMLGLTRRGWTHIQRLHLNRVPLVELRLHRAEGQRLHQILEHNQAANRQLQGYIYELEQEIERLLQIIAELTGQ